jgi:hypothetical protein
MAAKEARAAMLKAKGIVPYTNLNWPDRMAKAQEESTAFDAQVRAFIARKKGLAEETQRRIAEARAKKSVVRTG